MVGPEDWPFSLQRQSWFSPHAFSLVIDRFLWDDPQQAKHSPSCNTACMQGSAACGKIFAAEIQKQVCKKMISSTFAEIFEILFRFQLKTVQ